MADQKAAFIWAIKQQESGGDYSAVQGSTGALGAYQVLPSNLPSWLQQAGQPQMSPQQYLANPAAQDAVANTILGGYYDKYGAAGAASMWYSGDPTLYQNTGGQSNGPSIADYVNQVLSRMGAAPADLTSVPTSPAGLPNPITGFLPDIGGSIAKGLAQGILDSLKGILAPIFKWVVYGGEAVGGIAVMAVGGYIAFKGAENKFDLTLPGKELVSSERSAKSLTKEVEGEAKPKAAAKPKPVPVKGLKASSPKSNRKRPAGKKSVHSGGARRHTGKAPTKAQLNKSKHPFWESLNG